MTRADVRLVIKIYASWLASPDPRLADIGYREVMGAVEAYAADQCAKIAVPRTGRKGEPANGVEDAR